MIENFLELDAMRVAIAKYAEDMKWKERWPKAWKSAHSPYQSSTFYVGRSKIVFRFSELRCQLSEAQFLATHLEKRFSEYKITVDRPRWEDARITLTWKGKDNEQK